MIQLKFARVSRVAALIIFLSFLTPLVFAATTLASASLATATDTAVSSVTPTEFGFKTTAFTAAPATYLKNNVETPGWGSCAKTFDGTGDKQCAQIALDKGYVCTETTPALAAALGYDKWECDPATGKFCNTGCAVTGKFAGSCLCLFDSTRGNPPCTTPDSKTLASQTTVSVDRDNYDVGRCKSCSNLLTRPAGKTTPPTPERQEFVLAGVKRVYVNADTLESVDNLLTNGGTELVCNAKNLQCLSDGGFKVYIEFYYAGNWAVPSAVDSTRLLPPLRLSVDEVQFQSSSAITPGHDDNFNPGYPDKTIYSQGYGYYEVKQGTMVRVKAIPQSVGPVVNDYLWGWTVSGTISPREFGNSIASAFLGLTDVCSKATVDGNGKIILKDSTFGRELNLFAPVYVVAKAVDTSEKAYLKPVLVNSLAKVQLDSGGNPIVADNALDFEAFPSTANLCAGLASHAAPTQSGVQVNGWLKADYLVESYKEFPTGAIETGGKRVKLTRTSDNDAGLASLISNAHPIQPDGSLAGTIIASSFGAEFEWKRAKTLPMEYASDNLVMAFNLYQIKSQAYCYLEKSGKTLEGIQNDKAIQSQDKPTALAAIVAKGAADVQCPSDAYLEPVASLEQKLDIYYYYKSGSELKPLAEDDAFSCSGLTCTEKPAVVSTAPKKPVIVFDPKTGTSFQPGVYMLEATYPANQQAAPELATLSLNELYSHAESSGLTEYLLKVGTTYHTQDYTIRIDDASPQRILFRYRPRSGDSGSLSLDLLKEGDVGYEYAKYAANNYLMIGGIFQFKNQNDGSAAATGPYASFAECTGNSPKYCTLIVDHGTRAAAQQPGGTTGTASCTAAYDAAGNLLLTVTDGGPDLTKEDAVAVVLTANTLVGDQRVAVDKGKTEKAKVTVPETDLRYLIDWNDGRLEATKDGQASTVCSFERPIPPWQAVVAEITCTDLEKKDGAVSADAVLKVTKITGETEAEAQQKADAEVENKGSAAAIISKPALSAIPSRVTYNNEIYVLGQKVAVSENSNQVEVPAEGSMEAVKPLNGEDQPKTFSLDLSRMQPWLYRQAKLAWDYLTSLGSNTPEENELEKVNLKTQVQVTKESASIPAGQGTEETQTTTETKPLETKCTQEKRVAAYSINLPSCTFTPYGDNYVFTLDAKVFKDGAASELKVFDYFTGSMTAEGNAPVAGDIKTSPFTVDAKRATPPSAFEPFVLSLSKNNNDPQDGKFAQNSYEITCAFKPLDLNAAISAAAAMDESSKYLGLKVEEGAVRINGKGFNQPAYYLGGTHSNENFYLVTAGGKLPLETPSTVAWRKGTLKSGTPVKVYAVGQKYESYEAVLIFNGPITAAPAAKIAVSPEEAARGIFGVNDLKTPIGVYTGTTRYQDMAIILGIYNTNVYQLANPAENQNAGKLQQYMHYFNSLPAQVSVTGDSNTAKFIDAVNSITASSHPVACDGIYSDRQLSALPEFCRSLRCLKKLNAVQIFILKGSKDDTVTLTFDKGDVRGDFKIKLMQPNQEDKTLCAEASSYTFPVGIEFTTS